jgi:HlyD family secretion protein
VAGVAWWGQGWWGTARANAAILSAPVIRGELPIVITERGELESSQSVDVRCEVEGREIKLVSIVSEGSRVHKGQEVAKFDSESIQRKYAEQEVKWKQAEGKAKAATGDLEVQKNKEESEVAKVDLELTLAQLDHEAYEKAEYKIEYEDKKQGIELAKKSLKEAEEKLEFYRGFVKKGFGTAEQLQVKELEVQQTRYLVNRDEAKLYLLENFTRRRKLTEFAEKARDKARELQRTKKSQAAATEKAKTDLEAAEVTAKLEKQELDRLKVQLDRCTVLAPQDGIIVYSKERYWDASSRIQSGAMVYYKQAIFTLPDLSKMRVKVKFHESVIKKIRPGLTALIQIDALPNRILHGTVETVGTLAHNEGWRSNGVKEYMTEVRINDLPSDAGLKPGMTAEVKVQVTTLKEVVMVPVQAVTERDGQQFSYVAGPAGVERRPVTVGESNDQFIQVTEGLGEGEAVALDARARAAAEAKKQ